jgi:ABC-type multidrug transport system fused ATPase/permease subunit
MGNGYARGTLRLSFNKKSPILIISGLERLRHASKQTLVSRTATALDFLKLKCCRHDIDLVQLGISEKVTLAATFISAFFAAFIIAYIRSWRLALALSSILPCIGIVGGVMSKFVSKYTQ